MKDSNYEHRRLVAMSTTGRISVYPSHGNPPTVKLMPRIKADAAPVEQLPDPEIEVPRPRIVKAGPVEESSSGVKRALRKLRSIVGSR